MLPIPKPSPQSGNVLFFILIAIFLMGILTVAIQMSSQSGNENIDEETMSIRFSQIKQHTAEMENAVRFVFDNGFSETDIRFAHPDAHSDYGDITDTPGRQIFSPSGGGATYRLSPDSVNDGSEWEFYGGTSMPDVGSDEAELIAVLPNVTSAFCDLVNRSLGYSTQPQDTSTCVNEGAAGRFDDGTQFSSTPNTVNTGSFTKTPALKACVECAVDGSLHYVHVLMTR